MLKKFKINYLLIPLILITILISGCGGGDNKTVTPEAPPTPPTAKYNITGYVEDDPLVNATVTIKNENGDNLLSVTTDTNGMYTLNAAIEVDEEYTLLAVGELSGKTVTMHSQFVFEGSDSRINVNPLTELKYQLVQNNSQTLAQAEALVRDYFNIIKGESLEAIRFSTTDKAYVGLTDIAEIYGATLPIEAIEKVKDDIVRNDLSSSNQVKDYSYKSLVEQAITLDVSAKSLALNEELTVSLQGIDTLNENYTIVWGGLPDEVIEGTDISKTFTINEYAQDIYVTATLYKIHSEQEIYVATVGENINFYKPLEEVSAIVEDSTIDNEFTVSNALKMKVRANTLANGIEIKVTELQTNSEATLAQFAIDSNADSADTVMIEYNYDPYQVPEPRNLQVTLQGDGPKVIKINEIDYLSRLVKFELPLSYFVNRSNHSVKVIIELVKKEPTADQVSHLYASYMSYIEELLNTESADLDISERVINNIKSSKGKLKFTELMMRKNPQTGDYYFNILAATINYMIAEHHAEKMFNSDISWPDAKGAFYRRKNGDCVPGTYNGLPGECTTLENIYTKKIKEADQVLSAWVGRAKLTPAQAKFIQIAKIVTSQSLVVKSIYDRIAKGSRITAGELTQFYIGLTVAEASIIIETSNVINNTTQWTPSEVQGYAINLVTDGFATVIDGSSKFNFTSLAIEFGIHRAFDILEGLMIQSNTLATAPLIFALSEDYNLLTFENEEGSKALGFTKDDFINLYFPSSSNGAALDYRNHILDAPDIYPYSDSDESRLSSVLDPNQRFDKAVLQGTGLSSEGRGFLFTAFRYMYGDEEAKERFKDFLHKSKFLARNILFSVNEIPDSSIKEEGDACDAVTLRFSIQGISCHFDEEKKTVIKSKLSSSEVQDLKNIYFKIVNASDKLNLQELGNFPQFDTVMKGLIIRLPEAKFQALTFKEIKVETYGIGLDFSAEDGAWLLNESDKVQYVFQETESLNDKFIFNDETKEFELSFATLFEGGNFTQFDNKLVGFKILLSYENSGFDKVETADFVFTTLTDNENLDDTSFSGATLKSSVKDAVTGEALAGAFVTLNPGGLSSFTNENGDYEVSSLAAGNYTIIITKAGYKQVEASLTLTEDETKIYEVSLSIDNDSATTSGTTNVTIRDAYNGLVLTNGYISLREGQNNKTGEITQTVNSNGEANIDLTLFPGQYTLEIGANGYAKSYSTVTIIGGTRVVKEVSISPVLAEDQLRAVLTWGEFPRDLDSHLVKKINGEETYHIFYGNMSPANADANLDTDDTTSYGPETITINNIDPNAIYTYYVHNYSGGEDSVLPNSGAKIDIYSGESSQTLYIPNEGGHYWKVFEIANGEIVPCTENCVRDTDEGIARSVNNEALIFKGLPPK